MLGIFSTLGFGFEDDPDKIWVSLQITPCPRSDLDWEVCNVRLAECGLKDMVLDKDSNYPIVHLEIANPGFFFQIHRKQLLFFGGETFKAFMGSPNNERVFVLGDEPLNDQSSEVATDNGGRNYKYAPKIRLTLYAPSRYPKKLEQVIGSKQTEGTRYQNWKKVIGRYFQPAKDVLQPIRGHEHGLIPNEKLTGLARPHAQGPESEANEVERRVGGGKP